MDSTDPLTIVTLFSDSPRALAKSADGRHVYVAAFHSGNQTTALHSAAANYVQETNIHGEDQPHKGRIAKYIDGAWIDALGNDVSAQINFSLPDHDVFTIDAMATIPEEISGINDTFNHVGTTLFNMAVNPISGAIYVANTEANNLTRFEGPGLDPVVNTTTRGNIVQSRITIIKDGHVSPAHLNKHINYDYCCDAPGNAEARKSLAFPRHMEVSEDGKTLYVTAFGSGKIGVFDTEELENNLFQPSEDHHIKLTAGGPSGIALDHKNQRLYVLTRFNNGIDIINLNNRQIINSTLMHNPEPASITLGRPFLYDAFLSSSHGDSACASCHIDGDTDHLAWDLGDPTIKKAPIPGSFLARSGLAVADFATRQLGLSPPKKPGTNAFALALPECNFAETVLAPFLEQLACRQERIFHFSSNKGPMVTQTLAGLDNHGPMHWRGDRTGGTQKVGGRQPNQGMFNEQTSFKQFNAAFPGLLGRDEELTNQQMSQFTDFILQNVLPPNPIRHLDNSLTLQQAQGKEIFFGGPTGKREVDFLRTCQQCHTINPQANAKYGVERPGFFGTDGRFAFVFLSEIFKVPHMRNMYQKVGMFALHSGINSPMGPKGSRMVAGFPFFAPEHLGDQIRGFGFTHDGAVGSLFQFYQTAAFVNGNGKGIAGVLNQGGFLPYVEEGTWDADAEYPEAFSQLAKTNDPFYRQINPETGQPIGLEETRAVEAFSFVFPTNMAPAVGQQVTRTDNNWHQIADRLALLEAQAQKAMKNERCDLVAKSRINDIERGYLFDPKQGLYISSDNTTKTRSELISTPLPITFTCVPPGDGVRAGLDRDGDGYSDFTEVKAGSNPADKTQLPVETDKENDSLICRWLPFFC